MGKLQEFDITFTNNKVVYGPGESISGNVKIRTGHSLQYKGRKLFFNMFMREETCCQRVFHESVKRATQARVDVNKLYLNLFDVAGHEDELKARYQARGCFSEGLRLIFATVDVIEMLVRTLGALLVLDWECFHPPHDTSSLLLLARCCRLKTTSCSHPARGNMLLPCFVKMLWRSVQKAEQVLDTFYYFIKTIFRLGGLLKTLNCVTITCTTCVT